MHIHMYMYSTHTLHMCVHNVLLVLALTSVKLTHSDCDETCEATFIDSNSNLASCMRLKFEKVR